MGLRERKAARTRDHIIDVAIELFLAQGYEQTTIEQIAETAEVATSTLYRYFPSKELLILDRLLRLADLGSALKLRPPQEPLGESLTIILRDSLESMAEDPRGVALRRIFDVSPAPRSRLWDLVDAARIGLEVAIAERTGLPPGDLSVTMAARLALQVFAVAAERWARGDGSQSRAEILNDILVALADRPLILPTPINGRDFS